MSIEAINWSFSVRGIKSSEKLVLVALANHANTNGEAWPSICQLSECTSLDRKTVMKSIGVLVECGLIECVGTVKGETRRVKTYRMNTNLTDVNSTRNGTVKQSQKRNSPKNGTVPDFPLNSPKFSSKQSQISHETVPDLGHGTIKEPLKNHQGTVRECAREPGPVDNPKPPDKLIKRKTRLPDNWFLPKDWGDWALEQGLTESEIRTEAECFADYWRSKEETRADWQATWRNWIRRRRTFERRPLQNGSKKSIYEQNREAGARAKKLIFGDAA